MTDTAAPPAAPAVRLPLFYSRPEVLQRDRHAAAGLRPFAGYGFSAEATAIPIQISEFAKVAVTCPIVFAGRETLSPVAVVGLRRNQNLFVDAEGGWAADAHVPAYLRRWPFILTRAEAGSEDVILCIEAASGRLAPDAAAEGVEPLFDGGMPSEPARRALDLCLEFERQAAATIEITRRLREAGLLVPQEGKVELGGGEKLRLTDFHVVSEQALNALDAATFEELRRIGAIASAYCQLVSMNTWSRLSAMATARGAPPAAS